MRKKTSLPSETPEHLDDSRLLDRIEGRPGEGADNLAIERHLNRCARCRKRLRELAGVARPLLSRDLERAPEWLRNWSEDLPTSHPRRADRPSVRHLRLTFDSWALEAAGARSVASGVRRLVFRSGPIDLDLQVETRASSGKVKIRGQVLDASVPGGRSFTSGEVRLEPVKQRGGRGSLPAGGRGSDGSLPAGGQGGDGPLPAGGRGSDEPLPPLEPLKAPLGKRGEFVLSDVESGKYRVMIVAPGVTCHVPLDL